MTHLEVIDTAIKIIGPAAIAAGATLTAVSIAASRENDKDARRRRQDALEKVVDMFEAAHSTAKRVIAAFLVYARLDKNDATKRMFCLREFEVRMRAYDEAEVTLLAIVGRCQMMGLSECSKVIDAYIEVIEQVTMVLETYHEATPETATSSESIFAKLNDRRREMHLAVNDAFYTI